MARLDGRPEEDPAMTTTYEKFLAGKSRFTVPSGFEAEDLNPMLFPFQKGIVKWALRRGRAAIFADCGLGKTPMQLEWARHVVAQTGGRVLILAPLAVSYQVIAEGIKFGIEVERRQESGGNSPRRDELRAPSSVQPVGVPGCGV
jgi:hypothetical protein